eukprot:Tbor_TRINITY_DN5376_c0_g1::TRINITY_DN5376_c0_g1_i3::g.5130::m.5130
MGLGSVASLLPATVSGNEGRTIDGTSSSSGLAAPSNLFNKPSRQSRQIYNISNTVPIISLTNCIISNVFLFLSISFFRKYQIYGQIQRDYKECTHIQSHYSPSSSSSIGCLRSACTISYGDLVS